MNTRAVRAGGAFIELYLDSKKLTAGLNKARAQLQTFGQAATSIGRSMMGVSAAALAPVALSLGTYAKFAAQMSEVKAITGATEAEFGRLQKTAKDLGSTTSFSASQVAEGMKFLGMAGFTTEQIIAGIPGVLNLAKAGAVDLGTAADIASDVGSAFGMAADEIGRIADVMAVTASSANTSIAMMGETLKYAAPLAKAAGQSLEDTATAIGVLGNSGIKASMAGTDLANMMKKIGSEAKDALAMKGVQTTDAQGNIRSIIEVMHELGAATRDMSESDRLAFFAKNFDRSAKSALILADAGKPMDDLRKKINNADGAAAKMADTMGDNLLGAWTRFMSAVEGIQIAIGEALAKPLSVAIDLFAKIAGGVGTFIQENHGLVAVLVGVAAVIGTVGTALVVAGLAAMLLAGVIGGLTTLVGMAATAWAFLMTPLGIGIVVVAGLTAGLLALAAGVLYVTGVLGMMLEAINGLWDGLLNIFLPFLSALASALIDGEFEKATKMMWLAFEAIAYQAMADVLRFVGSWTKMISDMIGGVASGLEALTGRNSFTVALRDAAAIAKYSERFADALQKGAGQKYGELRGLIDEINNPPKDVPEPREKPEEQDTAPAVPDLSGVGARLENALRFAVGTFSDVGAMAIRSQARPMEKVERQLDEIGEDIAAIRQAAEDGDGVVFG